MKRGHISVGRTTGVTEQEKILTDAGVTIIYRDDILAAVRSLRKGDKLYVDGLRGLATSRKLIDAALNAIHAKGACAVDAATGWRSNGPNGWKLMSKAIADLSAARQGGHDKARKHGQAGGIASGKAKAKGRMPWSAIERIWFNKSLDRDELMERINTVGYKEISYYTIHKHLGPRGVTLGRRPKEQ
jgi:hypothetical protein